MVRIGSLVDMIHAEYTKKDIAGMSAKEQLDALMEETHKFAALQYSTYNRMLLPQLRANGLNFCGASRAADRAPGTVCG